MTSSDLQEHGAGREGGEAAVAAGAALEVGPQDAEQHEEGGHEHAAVGQAWRRHVAVRAPVLAHEVLHQLCQPVGHVLPGPCHITAFSLSNLLCNVSTAVGLVWGRTGANWWNRVHCAAHAAETAGQPAELYRELPMLKTLTD